MQRKLFIASLTAMAQQAYAVQTKISAQASAEQTTTPADSLISIYANCQVEIGNLVGYQSTLGNQLKLSPTFDLSGIDENCPDMSATVWLEPPTTCAHQADCPTDGLSTVIEPADMVNGKWSKDFTTTAISGEWFVHVTITPTGFDCAMAITDACSGVNVQKACAAEVTGFEASNSVNTALGPADTYNGPNGIIHHFNWAVSDLWNCDLCASYAVSSLNGESSNSATMTWDQLYQFSQVTENSRTLETDTSYQPYVYDLTISECSTGAEYWHGSVELANPHPACAIEGDLKINSASSSGEKLTDIAQQVMFNPLYSCGSQDFQATLKNNEFYEEELKSIFEEPGTSYAVQSTPQDYTSVIWENLPISLNTTIDVLTKWTGVNESDWTQIASLQATKDYWPNCDYSVFTPTLQTTIVNGTAWGEHTLTLDAYASGEYGWYCPGFESELTFYHDGQKQMSVSLTQDETDEFFVYGSDYTGTPIHKSQTFEFTDGDFCIEFSMTPTAAKPGEDPVTVSSSKVCKTVNAYMCEVEPHVSFTGTLNNDNQMMTYVNSASYQKNAWCQPDKLSFSWTYQYMNMAWADETEDGIPYVDALTNDQAVSDTWTESESDFEVKTRLEITYAPTDLTSQLAGQLQFEANSAYSHQQTCRPKFSYEPSIYGIDLANDDTLTFNVLFETATTGMQNCGELYATVEIFDEQTDTIVYTQTLDNDEITQYQNVQRPPLAMTGLPEVGACYMVKITYGQVGHTASAVSQSTDTTCYWPTCELSNPTIVLVNSDVDSNGDTVQWTFQTSVTTNKWCEYVNQQVCVKDEQSGAMWCNQPDTSENDATVVVTQHGDFSQTNFTGLVDITSSNGTHVDAETPVVLLMQPEWCYFDFDTSLTFWTDTLTKVGINQTAVGSSSKVCGTPYIMYQFNNDGSQTAYTEVMNHYWQVPSTTGTYSFTTFFKFANFWDHTFSDNGISATWTQGCDVQIDQITWGKFIAADNSTDTLASANLNVNGTKIGNCGNSFNFTAVLSGSDGSSYDLAIDSSDFFSVAGQDLTQEIARTAENYTFAIEVVATNAESIADHQAQTESTGYTQVLSDKASTMAGSIDPVCNVVINSIQFDGYKEESNWEGPMLASYSGQINAEYTCQDLTAQLRLRGEDATSYINAGTPELVQIDTYTYNYSITLEGPNVYGNYFGKLQAYDANNEADKAWASTDEYLWDPPCYLEILNFEKTDQYTTVDDVMTQLSYSIAVAEHGDNACRDNHLEVIMQGTDGNKFRHWFDDNDREKALQTYGFNYTVQIESSGAPSAEIEWKDVRAVENQTANADGYLPPNELDCRVNVMDFCLTDAAPIAGEDNRWNFDFTIRVQSNSNCGTLSAWMDLIYEEGHYLGGVSIPGETLVDSFNCNCEKTFSIEADYDGTPGDVYGQLDIRNSAQQIVQITDSCVKSVPS